MDTPDFDTGDVLIRQVGRADIEIVDALSLERIAVAPTLEQAIGLAARHRGAVWRENTDDRGRRLGPPRLLLPRIAKRQ